MKLFSPFLPTNPKCALTACNPGLVALIARNITQKSLTTPPRLFQHLCVNRDLKAPFISVYSEQRAGERALKWNWASFFHPLFFGLFDLFMCFSSDNTQGRCMPMSLKRWHSLPDISSFFNSFPVAKKASKKGLKKRPKISLSSHVKSTDQSLKEKTFVPWWYG